MPIAVNPQNGQAVFLDSDGAWKPAQTAVNPKTKQMLAFDGKDWSPVPGEAPNALLDVAKSLPTGVAKGAIAGMGGDVREAVASAGSKIGIPAALTSGALRAFPLLSGPSTEQVNQMTGGLYEPKTGAGHLAQTVGEFAPFAFGGPGGIASRVATRVAAPALGSEAAGALTDRNPLAQAAGALVAGLGAGGVQTIGRNVFNPRNQAAADLARAGTRDQLTPDQLISNLQSARQVRPDASIADVGGENIRGLVERVAQTPGAGRTQVVPELTQRQQGQMARISSDLRSLTGTTRTAAQATEETMAQRAKDATPIYEDAFNFNARAVPEIVDIWQKETSTGHGRALLLNKDFKRNLQTEYGITNPEDAPLMVQIDAWKKVADDFIRNNLGSNSARIVQKMRGRVLDAVDKANPKYAEARNVWAGPSEYLESINEGRQFLSTKIGSDELARGIEAMSASQREGYITGAVSSIIAKMGNDPAKLADMTKYLRSPEVRAKIAAIMPTPEARAKWDKILNYEIGSSELAGRALGNSATARRLAERADAESLVGDLIFDAFNMKPPISLINKILSSGPQKIRDTLRSKTDAILADMLTGKISPDEVRAAMSQQRQSAPVIPQLAGPGILSNPAVLPRQLQGPVRARAEDEQPKP